jgi:hypothetical protein
MPLLRKQVFVSILVFFSLIISKVAVAQNLGFEAAEHIAAGQNVKLHFYSDDPGQSDTTLHLENGLAFTYAQLLAISGDFYGIPGHTISEGKSLQERKEKFLSVYNTLAQDPAARKEAPQIFAVIEKEQNSIAEGMKNGEKPEDIYARIANDNNRQWNCITGGGCATSWWLVPGRYLTLSKKDYDHFGDHSWLAYEAGHAVALDTAQLAHQTNNIKLLETAYAINAFASHYLSDHFAAGHLRTPRLELPTTVTPAVFGSILVHFMHDEENQYGMHVHNLRGDHWFAAGDQYFFTMQNKQNRSFLEEALQASVNDVFYAYRYGMAPLEDKVYQLIPQADETGNQVKQDISPLFYWDNASRTLYRRSDVSNAYDNHWTSHWWGWSTIILLAKQRGVPALVQQDLAAAGYGKKAMEEGLITEQDVLNYVKKEA